MTATDHAMKPLENILHERGHPYMDTVSRCPRNRQQLKTRLPDAERSPLAGKFKAMNGDLHGLKAFKNNG